MSDSRLRVVQIETLRSELFLVQTSPETVPPTLVLLSITLSIGNCLECRFIRLKSLVEKTSYGVVKSVGTKDVCDREPLSFGTKYAHTHIPTLSLPFHILNHLFSNSWFQTEIHSYE